MNTRTELLLRGGERESALQRRVGDRRPSARRRPGLLTHVPRFLRSQKDSRRNEQRDVPGGVLLLRGVPRGVHVLVLRGVLCGILKALWGVPPCQLF